MTCWHVSPRVAPACSCRPSTASRTAPSRRASSPPRGSASRPRSPSTTPGSTGPSRRSRSTVASGRARPDPAPGRPRTGSGSSSVPSARSAASGLEPGPARGARKNDVFVGTATGPVRLGRVKPYGKKEMDAADWARGVRLEPGCTVRVASAASGSHGARASAGPARGRRRDLRRPAGDLVRHLLGRRTDLAGPARGRRATRAAASCSTASRTRPRSIPRRASSTTTCW